MLEPRIEVDDSVPKARRVAFWVTAVLLTVSVGLVASRVGLPAGIHAGFAISWLLTPWLYGIITAVPMSRLTTRQSYTVGKFWALAYLMFLALCEVF